MASLITLVNPKSRVSSVLNKDVKQFGKQFMFDSSEETCWNSHQGSPQYVIMEFDQKVIVEQVYIMFQGGFAGKECEILCSSDDEQWIHVNYFYPHDSNEYQAFEVRYDDSRTNNSVVTRKLKILFASSTDFYGRITVYKLDVLGHLE